jgi:hypothetical protein
MQNDGYARETITLSVAFGEAKRCRRPSVSDANRLRTRPEASLLQNGQP